MQQIKAKLIKALGQVIILLTKQVTNLQTQLNFKQTKDKGEYIYKIAKSLVGQKLRTIGREKACAEVANKVFEIATGKQIGGGISTMKMYNKIRLDKRFKEVKIEDRKRGDLILSPTGHKRFWSKVKNGHVGFLLENDIIGSNSSKTGLLATEWSFGKWMYYYHNQGGYFVKIYRVVS